MRNFQPGESSIEPRNVAETDDDWDENKRRARARARNTIYIDVKTLQYRNIEGGLYICVFIIVTKRVSIGID